MDVHHGRCQMEGIFYSKDIDDCLQCPSKERGCYTILDETTQSNCLKSCKAGFPTDPVRIRYRNVIQEIEMVDWKVILLITALVISVLVNILMAVYIIAKRRKQKNVGNSSNDEENLLNLKSKCQSKIDSNPQQEMLGTMIAVCNTQETLETTIAESIPQEMLETMIAANNIKEMSGTMIAVNIPQEMLETMRAANNIKEMTGTTIAVSIPHEMLETMIAANNIKEMSGTTIVVNNIKEKLGTTIAANNKQIEQETNV